MSETLKQFNEDFNLKDWLEGQWLLKRTVTESSSQKKIGEMTGDVKWEFIDSQNLAYHESGILRNANYQGPFYQGYRFYFPSSYQTDVFFSDNRFFCSLFLKNNNPCYVKYYCKQDIYAGSFKILSETEFLILWSIFGPRKGYWIESSLKRCS